MSAFIAGMLAGYATLMPPGEGQQQPGDARVHRHAEKGVGPALTLSR